LKLFTSELMVPPCVAGGTSTHLDPHEATGECGSQHLAVNLGKFDMGKQVSYLRPTPRGNLIPNRVHVGVGVFDIWIVDHGRYLGVKFSLVKRQARTE
jgi:hypothetical protein